MWVQQTEAMWVCDWEMNTPTKGAKNEGKEEFNKPKKVKYD